MTDGNMMTFPELWPITRKNNIPDEVANQLFMDALECGHSQNAAIAYTAYIASRVTDGIDLVNATGDNKWQSLMDNHKIDD